MTGELFYGVRESSAFNEFVGQGMRQLSYVVLHMKIGII